MHNALFTFTKTYEQMALGLVASVSGRSLCTAAVQLSSLLMLIFPFSNPLMSCILLQEVG